MNLKRKLTFATILYFKRQAIIKKKAAIVDFKIAEE